MTSKKVKISALIYGSVALLFCLFELIAFFIIVPIYFSDFIYNLKFSFCCIINIYFTIFPVFILLCISKIYDHIENKENSICKKSSFINYVVSKTTSKNLKIVALINIIVSFIFMIISEKLFGDIFTLETFIKTTIEVVFYYMSWPAFFSIVLLAVSFVLNNFEKNEEIGKNYSKIIIFTIIYGITALIYCIYKIILSYTETIHLLQNYPDEILRFIVSILFNLYLAFMPTIVLLSMCKIFKNNKIIDNEHYSANKDLKILKANMPDKNTSEQNQSEQCKGNSFLNSIFNFISYNHLEVISLINIIIAFLYGFHITISSTNEISNYSDEFNFGLSLVSFLVCFFENFVRLIRLPIYFTILFFIISDELKHYENKDKSILNNSNQEITEDRYKMN